jgi:hypothetical protein
LIGLKVYLYRPPDSYSFPIDELAEYLAGLLGGGLADGGIEVRGEFFSENILAGPDASAMNQAGESLARCRLDDIKNREFPAEQSENLRVFYSAMELSMIEEGIPPEKTRDFLYHGPRLMNVFSRYLDDTERTTEHLHLIFTDRLFCTWDNSDARYHARAVIMGFPNMISMPGIVEAPARPREYYIKKHLYASGGLPADELEAEFAGQYLIYRDARTLEVLKGYSLQTVFYTLFWEAFCNDEDCRLFNAHWQKELLHSQVESGKLCERHMKMLEQWKDDSGREEKQ